MKSRRPVCVLSTLVLLALGLPAVASAAACLLTLDELKTATGREFGVGQEGKAVDGSGLCVYAEAAAPTRKMTINVIESRAKAAFESRVRMLTMSKKDIGLKGVGDAAYFNGTSAGALAGDKLIVLSGVRRPSAADIPSERIVALLQAALARVSK